MNLYDENFTGTKLVDFFLGFVLFVLFVNVLSQQFAETFLKSFITAILYFLLVYT